MGKITTIFEPINIEDILIKIYPDQKPLKINGHISLLEKNYNEYFLNYNKQSVEDILIQKAVKTTFQRLHEKGFFDNYANADKVLEDFLFVTRRVGDLEEVNDVIQ